MMQIEYDGIEYEFPEGTTNADISKALTAYLGKSAIREPQGFNISNMISNIPKSTGNVIKGVYDAVINPRDTIGTLGKVGLGYAEKLDRALGLGAAEVDYEPYADATNQYFKDRYGGKDAILNTLENDPVGIALDISTPFTLGGGLPGRAGQIAGRIGRATDPLIGAGKTLQHGLKYTSKGLDKASDLGKNLSKKIYRSAYNSDDIDFLDRLLIDEVIPTKKVIDSLERIKVHKQKLSKEELRYNINIDRAKDIINTAKNIGLPDIISTLIGYDIFGVTGGVLGTIGSRYISNPLNRAKIGIMGNNISRGIGRGSHYTNFYSKDINHLLNNKLTNGVLGTYKGSSEAGKLSNEIIKILIEQDNNEKNN